ncbi:MAG: tRNA 2-thiouridine(34) synthase MnmA [Andreesenia angusta]|nr:tRNA 2-thiouridine(34) synthase MnmA [Andreesenia angusta]
MKIGIGLSGGVDSAVSAFILKRKGYYVKGYTMFLYDDQYDEINTAKNIAKDLGIEYEVIDLRSEFKTEVIDRFTRYYINGLTPNPCLFCNEIFKYDLLLKYAKSNGMDKFAMGHYAKILYSKDIEEYRVLRANDRRKDQSYNLFKLNQRDLSFLNFPIGEFQSKAELRKFAQYLNLSNAEKKDSRGICFLGKNSLKTFFSEYAKSLNRSGNIVDKEDNYLGRHNGIYNYTIGQKKRLYLEKNCIENPTVIKIDARNNKIIIGTEVDLNFKRVYFTDSNLISNKQSFPFKAHIKLSQWSSEYIGLVNSSYVEFDDFVRAPAPGQGIVFYDYNNPDILLGGGIIRCSE